MTDLSDRELVKNLLDWGKYHRFNLSETARLIGRTRAWASAIKKTLEDGGEICLLQPTRDNIIEILGLQEE